MSTRTRAAHVLRGGLIGAAEAIPGVSGGTVALVTGVYEVVITSAGHLVSGVTALVTDRARARQEFRAVRWDVLVPLLIGMFPALLIALLLLAPAIEEYPVQMRALFFGMVAAALIVPVSMVGPRWRLREVLFAAAAAVAAYLLTGQLQLSVDDPSLPVVFLAAAVAVCALVLPGVSGAFLLLAFGLYGPTREAVRNLDLGYVGVFALGAICGLSVFVKGLQWLLEHRRRITLAVMTGLIVGALRALWPWQTEDNDLLAPDSRIWVALALFVLGAAIVVGILVVERRAALSRDHGVSATTRGRHAEEVHDRRG
jgi:putative membrane protein